jgi:hypothetical protein
MAARAVSPRRRCLPQEIIFTDDVSLQVFMEHLARLSVQS